MPNRSQSVLHQTKTFDQILHPNSFMIYLSNTKALKAQSPLIHATKRLHNFFLEGALIFFSIIFASSVKNNWHIVYSYFNKTAFNTTDPLFEFDLSFYFFSLPFYELLQNSLFSLCIITLILVTWIYFTSNILSYLTATSKKSGIKTHIFILLGFLILIVAGEQVLNMFNILYSTDGRVIGAGYADVQARLFSYKLLISALCIQALLCFIWAFRTRILTPLYFSGVVIVIWVVVLKLYPSFVQNYIVNPNELEKEKPYILNNIEFTRKAYNLDTIKEVPFKGNDILTSNDIQKNRTTINNIRLWNPGPKTNIQTTPRNSTIL